MNWYVLDDTVIGVKLGLSLHAFWFKLKFTISKTSSCTEFSSKCLRETPGNETCWSVRHPGDPVSHHCNIMRCVCVCGMKVWLMRCVLTSTWWKTSLCTRVLDLPTVSSVCRSLYQTSRGTYDCMANIWSVLSSLSADVEVHYFCMLPSPSTNW